MRENSDIMLIIISKSTNHSSLLVSVPNREITKFHFICFCVSITVGMNQQDIESLKLLIHFLGKELSKNSCLIVTHCEQIGEKRRDDLRKQLLEDADFKDIAPFFELGTFFSGSIDRDDYNRGNVSIVQQYKQISEYRATLIDLFTTDIEPFQINQRLIDTIFDSGMNQEATQNKLRKITLQQRSTIAELKKAHENGQRDVTQLIDKLTTENNQLLDEMEASTKYEQSVVCNPS